MQEYKWPLMKDTITWADRLKLAKFVLTTDKFTQGPKVEEFERKWSKWLGAHPYSLFVSSGSTANFLLIDAIKTKRGLQRGDKVIVPGVTWVTSVNPIIQLGLQPIFVDVNLYDFSFDISALKQAANEHPDVKMVFTTHLLGFPADLESYREIFPKAIFIDDVCESHGCRAPDGSKIGSNSLGATFSFYFGHHMSTIEGGMVTTNDSDLYDLMKMKRSHGMARVSKRYDKYALDNPYIDKQFLFVTDGYNFRNTEIGAVLGIAQLDKLDGFIDNRRNRYREFVTILNHTNKFYPLRHAIGNSSFCFPFIAKSTKTKEKLIKLFQKHKIEYRPVVGGSLVMQPYLWGNTLVSKHNNTWKVHTNGVYIGNNQFVKQKDMYMLESILEELDE